MKVFFYNKGNPQLGSNRIYINNLSKWLNQTGIDVAVSNTLVNLERYNFCIMSKFSTIKDILFVKSNYPDIKIGTIHPSDINKNSILKIKNSDFLITGSIEEKDYYLNYHSNIFRFPQIEDIKCKFKNHNNSDVIKNTRILNINTPNFSYRKLVN